MKEEWMDQFPLPEVEPTTENVLAIDMARIKPNPYQPRREIAAE